MSRFFVLWVSILPYLFLSSVTAWAAPVRTSKDAQKVVRTLLAARTPQLNVANVREVDRHYEVEVVTSRENLVDRVLVEKESGQIRSLYGQMLLSMQPMVAAPTALPFPSS